MNLHWILKTTAGVAISMLAQRSRFGRPMRRVRLFGGSTESLVGGSCGRCRGMFNR